MEKKEIKAQSEEKGMHYEEKVLNPANGLLVLVVDLIIMLGALGLIIKAASSYEPSALMIVIGALYLFVIGPMILAGVKVIKPNEALVLTLFGKYYGSIKKEGIFFVNPFTQGFNPVAEAKNAAIAEANAKKENAKASTGVFKKISLKTMTLSNEKQKINDLLGNPIVIGIVVIWRVENTAKAVFNVDDYQEFLSMQCDSALRNIVRLYPYDLSSDGDEQSLRGSSQDVAQRLKEEIQERVEVAGLQILEARITHLAYAPEIAAAMLQRQQASAIIDARKIIVEGAVSMVQIALEKLNEKDIVQLDEERKAAMVSNLLVILCGNKEAQPIVNSGSIY